MSLSERIRPNVEAAPWVIDEVAKLEAERDRMLDALRLALASLEANSDEVPHGFGGEIEAVRRAIGDQPAAPAEPEPVTYSHDDGSGELFVGSFPTPEDAAADALQENDAESVEVGENRKRPASYYVSGVEIVEDVQQRAYDTVDEAADEWLSGLFNDKPAMADLERLVGAWIDQREPVRFWEVVNIRTITRAELIASGHLEADG